MFTNFGHFSCASWLYLCKGRVPSLWQDIIHSFLFINLLCKLWLQFFLFYLNESLCSAFSQMTPPHGKWIVVYNKKSPWHFPPRNLNNCLHFCSSVSYLTLACLADGGVTDSSEIVYDPDLHTPSPRRSLRTVSSSTSETTTYRRMVNNGKTSSSSR